MKELLIKLARRWVIGAIITSIFLETIVTMVPSLAVLMGIPLGGAFAIFSMMYDEDEVADE